MLGIDLEHERNIAELQVGIGNDDPLRVAPSGQQRGDIRGEHRLSASPLGGHHRDDAALCHWFAGRRRRSLLPAALGALGGTEGFGDGGNRKRGLHHVAQSGAYGRPQHVAGDIGRSHQDHDDLGIELGEGRRFGDALSSRQARTDEHHVGIAGHHAVFSVGYRLEQLDAAFEDRLGLAADVLVRIDENDAFGVEIRAVTQRASPG